MVREVGHNLATELLITGVGLVRRVRIVPVDQLTVRIQRGAAQDLLEFSEPARAGLASCRRRTNDFESVVVFAE